MNQAELEAENARLRAALMDAGIDPDHVVDRPVQHELPSSANPPLGQPDVTGIAVVSRQARYRAVFESALDFAIVVTNPQGIVTDWNPGAERVLGWSAGEMQASNAERIFTPEDRAAGVVQQEMTLALKDRRAADDRWHLRKNGQRF